MNNFWIGVSSTFGVLNAVFLSLYLITGWKLDMVKVESRLICPPVLPAHEPTKGKGK